MRQICISSDIQTTHLILNYDDLLDVLSLGLNDLKEDIPLLRISGETLGSLMDELNNAINSILSERNTRYLGRNTIMKYRGVAIKLNLRDDRDFYLAALINLLDIVAICIEKKGSLFIYNKNLFQEYNSDSIISFLRVHYRLSREGLRDGLNELLRNSRKNQEMPIDYNTLDAGLKYLQYHGLVFYDSIQDKYELTARGYICF